MIASFIAYSYHEKSLSDSRNEAIIALGDSMAESDLKINNLRWFWYSEGFNTNAISTQYFGKDFYRLYDEVYINFK